MQNVVRLEGFGTTVVPQVPYRIDRVVEAPESTLRVASGERSAIVDARDVVRGTAATPLADITPGDPTLAWRIVTSVFACTWPRGFALASDPDELSPFLLVGENEAMIWIAGPIDREEAMPIESLATEDQTIRAVADSGDNARLDVDYEHDGERWWQRRYVLAWVDGGVLVVTAQARAVDEDATRAAIDAVEASIAPAAEA